MNTSKDGSIADSLFSIGSPAAEPRAIIMATSNMLNCLTPFFPDDRRKINTSENIIIVLIAISNASDQSRSFIKMLLKFISNIVIEHKMIIVSKFLSNSEVDSIVLIFPAAIN